jgi:hypothetical protein
LHHAPSDGKPSHLRISLLDADPELGSLLPEGALEHARRELVVCTATVDRGVWNVTRLVHASPANTGLLLLEGVAAREVVLGRAISTELLGAGDLVRPWSGDGGNALIGSEVRWNFLSPGRVAVLDTGFAARAAAFPGIGAMLMERIEARARRLADAKAIAQMTRVEARLLALMWQLAERWGRVTPDGVIVPLRLSHRLLGELVGARRPTVSAASMELARRAQLERRADGTWLLHGDLEQAADVPVSVEQRHRLVPAEAYPALSVAAAV